MGFVSYWYLIVILALSLAITGGMAYISMLKKDKEVLISENLVLSTQLAVSEESVKGLSSSLDIQNEAVRKLQAESDARQLRAKKEVDEARKKTVLAENRAKELMKKTVPSGKNICAAADDLINAEIKNAR